MSSLSLGFIVEGFVTLLLILTIGYCIVLNRRLKRLHADEEVLKATISELLTATEIAERAIHGLKETAGECDRSLIQRLAEAERVSAEIDSRLVAGEAVLKRIAEIAEAAAMPADRTAPKPQRPDLRSQASAAAARLKQMRDGAEEQAA
ncbi:hypothetical protein GGD81_000833 [Rhodobium orientis]|uniref:DUF6468 domain-containing protein n=1 Tax=Rhodobium orientis TaxID=34017 RepID=A0A327JE08_9HYPH|nr:DUF6468 domain-containing protein [Rhodobium orientis]MBB4301816.1 hypothetical protein [Rhodobium orientis]MBK5948409.1 hypothetical protein [Rhodobium orientis]RAI24650.1 hypothetical protein CH339_21730 [Rhodobium orientis]